MPVDWLVEPISTIGMRDVSKYVFDLKSIVRPIRGIRSDFVPNDEIVIHGN